jgi:hypothetical protein
MRERGEAPRRKQDAKGAARQAKDKILQQELPDDAAPAGAECEPYGDFGFTGGAPRQKEACHVHTRDEEDACDCTEQGQCAGLVIRGDRRDEGCDVNPMGGIRAGIFRREPVRDRVQIVARLRHGHPVLQPGNALEGPRAADFVRRREPHGRPQFGAIGEAEPARHYANNAVRLGIEPHDPTQSCRIAAEKTGPQIMAQHDRTRPGRRFLFSRKSPPEDGRHPKYLEKSGCHFRAFDVFRGVAVHERKSGGAVEGKGAERPVVTPPVDEVRIRVRRSCGIGASGVELTECHETVR